MNGMKQFQRLAAVLAILSAPLAWGSLFVGLMGVGRTEPIAVGIKLTADAIVVGTNRGAEQRIDGRNWADLEAALAKLRDSDEALAKVEAITVDAVDDVFYGDLVRAIETAHAKGFTQWALPPARGRR